MLYKGWLNLRIDKVRFSNGSEAEIAVSEVGRGVFVFALTDYEEVVLVRQWRHGIKDFLLVLPGGGRRKDETPLAAARRELLEETGYGGGKWKHWATFNSLPSVCDLKVDFFFARSVRKIGDSKPDKTEEIEVVLKPLGGLIRDYQRGKIRDWPTAIALGYFLTKKFFK